ncbi:hypothetical protein EMPS_02461 [Entomortierella parvispora]|uniref:Peptidase A1 domain-containing protein n=1 Tax=Entomortierella parvispora TaxID=205924 RepID=A0A9P3H5H2_9FUNG|nr:hypothetical protein EMPS_02461 [Entomortierella parvispora]
MRSITFLGLLVGIFGIVTCSPAQDQYPDISDPSNPRTVVQFKLNRKPIVPFTSLLDSASSTSIPLTRTYTGHSYTAPVSIGTSSTGGDGPTLDLLIDTGSDMVVVTSTSCTAPECQQVQDRYDCSASLTCEPAVNLLTGSPRWVQGYGDGTLANGTLVEDTLRFISSPSSPLPYQSTTRPPQQQQVVIPHQAILVVDQPGLGLFKSYGPGVDGILGLNLQSPVINRTVIQNLQALEDPSVSLSSSSSFSTPPSSSDMGFMSLWLGTSLEPGQGGGLLLNAVDKTRFQGPIQWVNRGPSPYDWSIPLDRGILLVNSTLSDDAILNDSPSEDISSVVTNPGAGETSRLTTIANKAPFLVPETDYSFAVLDSGSDGIYLLQFMYDALYPQIPGSKQLDNGYWRVPCEGSLDLVLGIQGQIYRVPYEEWVKKPSETSGDPPGLCQAKVFGSSPGPILLGTTFLQRVYTIFDFSHPGQERVGLAALA